MKGSVFEPVDCALVAREEDAAIVVLGTVEVAVPIGLRTVRGQPGDDALLLWRSCGRRTWLTPAHWATGRSHLSYAACATPSKATIELVRIGPLLRVDHSWHSDGHRIVRNVSPKTPFRSAKTKLATARLA